GGWRCASSRPAYLSPIARRPLPPDQGGEQSRIVPRSQCPARLGRRRRTSGAGLTVTQPALIRHSLIQVPWDTAPDPNTPTPSIAGSTIVIGGVYPHRHATSSRHLS